MVNQNERHLAIRIIDVNLNRAVEGLRVVEDYAKFIIENGGITQSIRRLRHEIRRHLEGTLKGELIENRLHVHDLGLQISMLSKIDSRDTAEDLLKSNLCRVQESLRVVEEYLKIIGLYDLAKGVEGYRHCVYRIEVELRSKAKPKISGLYGITSGMNWSELEEEILRFHRAGVEWVQYRDKHSGGLVQYELAKQIRKLTTDLKMRLIVNDRVDLALATDADGVHIGQEDIHLAAIRQLDRTNRLVVGISTHNVGQIEEAMQFKPDYIAIGPIYGTRTKANVEKCQGISFAIQARAMCHLPIVAIGGINHINISELYKLGIDGFAMISGLSTEESAQRVKSVTERAAHDQLKLKGDSR